MDPGSSSVFGSWDVGLETPPFGIGKIGGIAPFHAQELRSSSYLIRFSKQFRKVNSANFAGSALSEVRAKLESVAECLWWNGVRTRLDRAG